MSTASSHERARGTTRRKAGLSTEVAPLVRALVGTLARTPAGGRVAFEQHAPERLPVAIDREDLAEVLGNILENATRHALSHVVISARDGPGGPTITVEDDGPGIAADAQARVIERGMRLDQQPEGAGLGLAIVQDVLETYGWALTLGRSETLGGLKVTVGLEHREARADA